MRLFEYPYVIITILTMCFIVMGIIGLYFAMKSVKTAKEEAENGFCGIGKIESDFGKAKNARKNRSLVYVSVLLDGMKRLHPESRASRLYSEIGNCLLHKFSADNHEIALCGKTGFLVLNCLDDEQNAEIIEKVSEDINQILIKHSVVNIVGVNFGFHTTSSTEVDFKTALERAKKACSMAENSDELYCQWDTNSGKEFERKIKMENNIHSEIDNNNFFLEYQPIIDAKTEKIIGAEVLSRLNSADGIITPNTFLSAVNNVGINDKFDYYIFEKNCKWISNDKERRAKYVYTINFSRATFCDPNFADKIIQIVEKYGCSYSNIAVEILEDKTLTDEEVKIMSSNLKRLKEMGMLILLDDFGKGYTGFGDLTELDISIVKIDKTITQNAINSAGFVILKSIINTAHDLGLKTLCEGIETEEHKRIVVDAGCDLLQGFYFYRPMPVSKLESLFLE